MNTWAAYATAHASLTSGIGAGPMPAFGSASLYGFALGASAMVLAFVVMKSPRPLNLPWRLADLWSRAVRLTQGRRRRHAGPAAPISSRSRIRRRVDIMLLQMLRDDVDEHSPSCPAAADESTPANGQQTTGAPGPTARPGSASGSPTRGYRSKHRLVGSAKESQNHKRAPRHAAPPPAACAARFTNAR
jgi:hypothetical protein